jgi:hypothetical protein
MIIPSSSTFDLSTIASLLEHDPIVVDSRTFFSLFDPITAYLKVFLLRVRQGLIYTTQLRSFLLQHPLLILDFGFDLHLDSTLPFGFDPGRSLPSRQWLGAQLRSLDPALLADLLAATVRDLKAEIPGLGEVVAFDVKPIYACVKENNPRVCVAERYDKTQTLAGDPDCALGVKRSSNQQQEDGSIKVLKEMLWGSGSGVAAATTPDYGDVVLAEFTQPFNKADISYFRPLYQHTALALQAFPTHYTADAAFDAWYVHDPAARHGGIAAIPLNGHGFEKNQRDPDGVPLCSLNLRMSPSYRFAHPSGYRAHIYRCPLLFPTQQPGATCEHKQFNEKAKGCVKHINIEPGGLQRVLLDRSSPLYKAVYTQRTSCERINSQAKELGIERPKVRNKQSITNLNTLIYLIINGRALDRARSINKGLLQMS